MPSNGEAPATQAQLNTVHSELKSDINSVRSELKSEINSVRSELKSEINSVRSELKSDIARLAIESVKTQGQMGLMRDDLTARMNGGFARLTGQMDAFMAKLETYARESVTIPKTLDEHGKTLRDHEGRLRTIESSAQS